MSQPEEPQQFAGLRHGRYVGLLGLLTLAAVVVGTLLTSANGVTGLQPGQRLPPFAVPLASGRVEGDANIATAANQGQAGSRPACAVRGVGILNVCALYEHDPLVLALFVNSGGCTRVLNELQALASSLPAVRFAAVAIRGQRAQLRTLVLKDQLTLPVGYDRDGILASLYRLVSCPQVNFVYPGGVVQSRPLLSDLSLAQLRARVTELLAATRARSVP
jgi:hypothetical protein